MDGRRRRRREKRWIEETSSDDERDEIKNETTILLVSTNFRIEVDTSLTSFNEKKKEKNVSNIAR